jgi:Holliday junction resolvase RusA-like endonuclease
MTIIPLNACVICANCDAISDATGDYCPACSSFGLMSLANLLGDSRKMASDAEKTEKNRTPKAYHGRGNQPRNAYHGVENQPQIPYHGMEIVVYDIPPSVNHYRGFNRKTGVWFVRQQALNFKALVFAAAVQKKPFVSAKEYAVTADIYLPKGQRGDVDNFAKVILDSLQYAGVVENDSRIRTLSITKHQNAHTPRTEIHISPYHGRESDPDFASLNKLGAKF